MRGPVKNLTLCYAPHAKDRTHSFVNFGVLQHFLAHVTVVSLDPKPAAFVNKILVVEQQRWMAQQASGCYNASCP